jgi:hypothetical protein
VTNSSLATAAEYPHHRDQHHRQIAGTNHAQMCVATCRHCSLPFDVGWERLAHPTFRALCSPECFTAHRKATAA